MSDAVKSTRRASGRRTPVEPASVDRATEEQRGRSRTARRDRIGVWVVTSVAAVVAVLLLDPSPTGSAVVDAGWRVAGAVLVVLAASRARRWALLTSATIIALVAPSLGWTMVGSVAVAGAFVATLTGRHRVLGAVIGALTFAVACSLQLDGPTGIESVVAVVALAPMLASGYLSAPLTVRKKVRPVLLWGVVVVGAAAAVAAVCAALAWQPSRDAGAATEEGLRLIGDGDIVAGTEALTSAESSFGRAAVLLGGPWTWPARALPVVGPQVRAGAAAAVHGRHVTEAAAVSAAQADPENLRYVDGRVDLVEVAAAAPLLERTAEAMSEAAAALDDVGSPWLLPPVRAEVERFVERLDDVAPQAELAAVAAAQAPLLLGAAGPRRYLVLFTTPAEMRGAGGFVGNWALLEATDGSLDLAESGRALDVNATPGQPERVVSGPDDYVRRWGDRFEVGRFFQDVTLSPDVSSVAAAAAEIFTDARGPSIDGVITVDPYGLAALLELTGPMTVEGLDEPLDSSNAADWLLRRQYVELDDRAERADLLDEVSERTFRALVDGSIPAPRILGRALGPVAAEGRLTMVSFDGEADELLDLLGVRGEFPRAGDGVSAGDRLAPHDLFAVVTQNAANNKIDAYLQRSLVYEAVAHPHAGTVEATATVSLSNEADPAVLPEAVVGSNDRGLPVGTNRMFFSVYSPLNLVELRIDGQVVPHERDVEFGWFTYSTFLEVPPGATVVVELILAGRVEPSDSYLLAVPAQPLVHADDLRVVVSNQVGPGPVAPDGWTATSDGVTWSATHDRRALFVVPFAADEDEPGSG
ncbi:MAG: DUF4012 domain-containing protein [Acidimicrobiia bacterium]|nr:DUF4012 domain-containing protein [Acidimicrobiia bacterium]